MSDAPRLGPGGAAVRGMCVRVRGDTYLWHWLTKCADAAGLLLTFCSAVFRSVDPILRKGKCACC